jgi:hypothetical protein
MALIDVHADARRAAWARKLEKENAKLRIEIERLKTENTELKRAQATFETWYAKGEQFFGDKFITFSFHAGEWWADRPWRKRDE